MKIIKNLVKKYIAPSLSLIIIAAISWSCEKPNPELGIKSGVWRGELTAQGNQIPFNFEVSKEDGSYHIKLVNGVEKLDIDRIDILDDSLFFDMHIFDISIKAKIYKDSLVGSYTKNYADNYVLPFKAIYGKEGRFDRTESSNLFDGTWETTFKDKDGKESSAIGIFKVEDKMLRGTFLTKTGDYRYLDGYTSKDTMYLYTFDGNHIFKFRAYKENDSLLKGEYWSGKTSYKTFESIKNDTVTLPDANSLTYLKEGYDQIDFSFPYLDGKMTSLKDEKYKDKIVILQIFGTWCPNCMDETEFFTSLYNFYNEKGLEVIAVAFERPEDLKSKKERVAGLKDHFNAQYDFAIGGKASKIEAQKVLTALDKVLSFPTAIFIDRKGKVRKIHTGFYGPGTGKYYLNYIKSTKSFIEQLLNE